MFQTDSAGELDKVLQTHTGYSTFFQLFISFLNSYLIYCSENAFLYEVVIHVLAACLLPGNSAHIQRTHENS